MRFFKPISESQLQASLQADKDNEYKSSVGSAISDEVLERIACDTAIINSLTAETSARVASDTAIISSLTAETSARVASDTAIISSLTAETSARVASDTAIISSLTAETSARVASDTAIINSLTAETSARIASDTAIINSLTAETSARVASDTAIINSLTAETNARVASDTALQSALSNEISNRTAQFKTVGDSLNDEVNARQNADATLSSAINQIQTQINNDATVKSALESEITARTGANATINSAIDGLRSLHILDKADLQSSIGAEQSARQSDVSVLQSSISAVDSAYKAADVTLKGYVDGELDVLKSTDTAIWTALSNEVTLRNSQTSSLSSALSNEVLTRAGNFTSASNSISAINNALNAEITNRANKDSQLQSSLETAVTNFNAAYRVFGGSTTEHAGTAGIVPPPPILEDSDTVYYLTNRGWGEPIEIDIKIGKIPSQAGSLTFNGQTQSPDWNDYDPLALEITGATSASDAGTYTVYFQPRDGYKWTNGTKDKMSATYTINAYVVTIPTAAKTSFEYTGDSVTLNVVNFDSNGSSQTGVTSATGKGDYTARYELKNTNNYKWSDNTTAAKTISWHITVKSIDKPTISNATFDYDGNSHSPTVTGFNASWMSKSGTESSVNAGNFTITVALTDKTNTQWSGGGTADVALNWVINRKKLTAAQSTGFEQNGTITYGGLSDKWTVSIKNYDSTIHKLSGDVKKTYAGTYTAYVSPADNLCWSDGTFDAKPVTWKIQKRVVTKPTSKGTLTYNGSTQTGVNVPDSYADFYCNVTGKTAKDVGNYTCTYSITNFDKSSVVWEDGTTDDVVLNWSIVQGDGIVKPTLAANSFEWTGSNISPTVNNFDTNTMTKSGSDTAVAIGTYSITVALKDKNNTSWADGTTADVVLSWSITKRTLAKPTLATASYTYDGNSKTPTVNNFNSTYMEKAASSTNSATNAGSYSIIVNLKDTSNCQWSGGGTGAVTLNWTINRKLLSAVTFSQSGSLTYNGSSQNVTIANYDSTTMTASSTTSAVNAGTYTATVAPKSNYAWSDGSYAAKNVSWSIGKLSLAQPTLTNAAYTYDGNNHSPTINNFVSTRENMTGTTDTATAGTYTVTFSLKDTNNTQFTDSTATSIARTWTINKATLTKPSLSNATYTYNGDNHSPTINNYDSTRENMTGTTETATAGTYTVTFSLKNSTNYMWADSSTANVAATWTINKATPTLTLDKTSVTLDNETDWTDIGYSYSGDGTPSVTNNSDPTHIQATAASAYVRIEVYRYGSFTVTLAFPETTNYNAVSRDIYVTSHYIASFDDESWAGIHYAITNKKASEFWSVGDQRYVDFPSTIYYTSGDEQHSCDGCNVRIIQINLDSVDILIDVGYVHPRYFKNAVELRNKLRNLNSTCFGGCLVSVSEYYQTGSSSSSYGTKSTGVVCLFPIGEIIYGADTIDITTPFAYFLSGNSIRTWAISRYGDYAYVTGTGASDYTNVSTDSEDSPDGLYGQVYFKARIK